MSGGKAFRNASQWGNFSTLLRPDILSNGKSTTTFIKNGSNATAPALFARYTS
ncbi:MAG: hypothetical protein LBG59_09585 [Candidatus Peribacteria bacterium]|nr:hypothetical protein [Candidatus Peribacteria bacterium]